MCDTAQSPLQLVGVFYASIEGAIMIQNTQEAMEGLLS